ncbi:MAG: hypothetical protein WBE84_05235, partial [Xanthobacteraceae bacterium]
VIYFASNILWAQFQAYHSLITKQAQPGLNGMKSGADSWFNPGFGVARPRLLACGAHQALRFAVMPHTSCPLKCGDKKYNWMMYWASARGGLGQ